MHRNPLLQRHDVRRAGGRLMVKRQVSLIPAERIERSILVARATSACTVHCWKSWKARFAWNGQRDFQQCHTRRLLDRRATPATPSPQV